MVWIILALVSGLVFWKAGKYFWTEVRIRRVLPQVLGRDEWVGGDKLQKTLVEKFGITVSFERLQSIMYRLSYQGLAKRCCSEWGEAYRLA